MSSNDEFEPAHKLRHLHAGSIQSLIAQECDDLKEFILDKDRKYGSSVLKPMKVFSQADTKERIYSRLDDKICRLANGKDNNEDTIHDILGYLILLRVAEKLGLK